MAKVLIVYGSTTGNTEQVAKWIGTPLTALGHDVTVKNVVENLACEPGRAVRPGIIMALKRAAGHCW